MSDHPYKIAFEAQRKTKQYEQEASLFRQLPKRNVRRRTARLMLAVAKWLEPELTLSFPKNRERTLS